MRGAAGESTIFNTQFFEGEDHQKKSHEKIKLLSNVLMNYSAKINNIKKMRFNTWAIK